MLPVSVSPVDPIDPPLVIEHAANSNARNRMDVDDPDDASSSVAFSSRRSSVAASSDCPASTAVPMSRSAASDSVLPVAAKLSSPTFAHRKLRSGTPPEGPFPPMPLAVDQEDPKLFDMGPRMSSNYRCLGIDVGASVPGAPVGVKIGFESSGGDGAILIPRDPTERTRLKYPGVLKEYIKAHHKWMYETYGRIEAISVDSLSLIYGQDRTSDWAVAVSRDAARGAKVEFEIFGSASAGFWGNWSHTLSACQRGPHRPQAARHDQAASDPPADSTRNADQVRVPLEHKREDENRTWGMNIEGGVVNASFFFLGPSSKEHIDEEHARGRRRRSPPSRAHSITWSPDVHAAPDQTILIRRITACTSLGLLGFLPSRPKAAAEPRDPDVDSKRDRQCDPVHDQMILLTATKAQTSRIMISIGTMTRWRRCTLGFTSVKVPGSKFSIASDDDCLQLLSLLGSNIAAGMGLQAAVRLAADRHARISVDESGFATISVGNVAQSATRTVLASKGASFRPSSMQQHGSAGLKSNKENISIDMFAAAKRATSSFLDASSKMNQGQGSLQPRVMLPSSRANTLLPCRSIIAWEPLRHRLFCPDHVNKL